LRVCRLLHVAGVQASGRPARPSIARQSTQRTGMQPPTTGQSLPTVLQNGCENAETNDVPPQKPHAGMNGFIRKEGKEEYLYSTFLHRGTHRALRHGSHSFTCKQHHACLHCVACVPVSVLTDTYTATLKSLWCTWSHTFTQLIKVWPLSPLVVNI